MLALAPFLSACASISTAATAPPHVVFLLVDDNGWAGVGYNNPNLNTPHVDALAADGLKLTAHYTYKFCAPTRGSFLTGRLPFKLSATRANLIPWTLPDGTHLGYSMLPRKLKASNYWSAHIGKWHQGFYTPEYTPIGRGFDHSFGFLEGQPNDGADFCASEIMADFRAYVDGRNTAGMRKLSNEQRLSLMVLREHKVKLAWKCDTTKMFKPKVIKQRRGRDRGRGHGRNIDDAEQTHSSESGIIASASFWPKPVLSYRPHTEDIDGGVDADAGGGGGGAPPIHTSTSATLDWSDAGNGCSPGTGTSDDDDDDDGGEAEEDEEEGDEDEEEPKTVFAAVALTQTLLSLQCAAAASVVRDSPDVALNTVVQTVANSGPLQLQAARNSPGRRNFRAPRSRGMFQAGRVGTIVAHIPGRNEFVFMPSVGSKHTHWSTTPEPMLVDLSQFWFTCNPMPQVPLAPMKHLAAVDTKMFECQVCMEYKSADGFMPFCFRHFQITGDGHDMRDPRHPREICGACLRSLAMMPLSEGKLFVRCPAEGCSRSLQTLELKGIVTKGIYKELIDRTREVERRRQEAWPNNNGGGGSSGVGGGGDGDGDLELPAGIELRLCPECYCRIEKNHGCDTMNCYRCGHGFDWNDATLVNVGKIPTTDDTDGEGSQDGASDDSDAHEEGNGGGGGGGGGGGAGGGGGGGGEMGGGGGRLNALTLSAFGSVWYDLVVETPSLFHNVARSVFPF